MNSNDHVDAPKVRSAGAPDSSLRVELDPSHSLLQAIAAAGPENPLHTPAFADARRRHGKRVVAFLVTSGPSTAGCTGFISRGRLHRDLEIPSVPSAGADHPVWAALQRFCGDAGITRLRLQSLGSRPGPVPRLGRTLSRYPRREYVLDLRQEPVSAQLSSNHRRNVRRAERSGIHVESTSDPAASRIHAGLIDFSMSRRQEKGESASTGTESDSFRCYLEAGAGLIFQARDADARVLSSLLVLLSERGAYYHSAGTSPDGMRLGASQILVAKTAEDLSHRGIEVFNLGGAAEQQTGLARFKSGFGATPVELEAASFDVATGTRRGIVVVANQVRSLIGR